MSASRTPDYIFRSVDAPGEAVALTAREFAFLTGLAHQGRWVGTSNIRKRHSSAVKVTAWALAVRRGLRNHVGVELSRNEVAFLTLCASGSDLTCTQNPAITEELSRGRRTSVAG